MNRRKSTLFHQTLAATGCLSAAARAAGVNLDAARRLRAQGSPVPAAPARAAADIDAAVAALESEAVRRALEGVEVPVFHQGRECGSTVKHSDQLLMFLLKTLRPERYGARRAGDEPDGGPELPLDLVVLPEGE